MTGNKDCQNCNKTNSVEYTNGIVFCSGTIKNPTPIKKDVIRYCVVKEDSEEIFDMHIVETLDMISLLSESISTLFNPVDLDRLTTYIKDKNALV